MPDYQILLLPLADYWTWVDAAKDYVTKYGVGPTPDPDAAGRYMGPQQTITIAGLADGYPAQGDIRAWYREHYPHVRLDYLPCQSATEFGAALQARLSAHDRYLVPGLGLRLRWPTDFPIINEGFGEHPEIYRRWGLPGHDGVDIFAPHGGKVYAAAAGHVLSVEAFNGDPKAMPYGNSIHLQHADGYQTVYAHLQTALVAAGDAVSAGQVIGLADATGDSAGDNLHLVLMKAGATAARLTNYPRDIIDPTPYLDWTSAPGGGPAPAVYAWPPGFCLVGLHGRADGPMQAVDYGPIAQARIEAVKLLSTARPEDVDALRAQNPRVFIMLRMFASFDGRVVTSADFASWMTGDLAPFYSRGLRYFEVHNEPNLKPEGWTQSWADGQTFGAWFIDVRNRLKQVFPDALFGYPGLSPGDSIPGLRMAALDFLTGSDAACRAADWVGLHSYWQSEQEMNSAAGGLGYLEYRRRFPDKLLFVTEFSNPAPGVSKGDKGDQYARFYEMVRAIPGLGAAISFAVSASSGFPAETWRNEDGSVSDIPARVGARKDAITGTPPPARPLAPSAPKRRLPTRSPATARR